MTNVSGRETAASRKAIKVFNDHAAAYDSWFSDSLVYQTELAALRSLQTPLVKPMLEIGVGPGHFARDLGINLGLDPAMAPLELAMQRGIKCFCGVGEKLPFRKGTIGTIFLLFTLCFASAPRAIINESGETLKSSGKLIIGMIPALSAWGKDLAAKKEQGHIFYQHARFYTVATVTGWLADTGLSVIEARSTLYQPPDRVKQQEESRIGSDEEAGFVVMAAGKPND